MTIKSKIKDQLLKTVRDELKLAEEILKSANDFKKQDDMKQEDKYDTRSIEAGYLATAQTARVDELKLELNLIEEIPIHDFKKDEEASLGALVELEFNKQIKKYFVASTGGGTMLNIDGEIILVISVFSPIGNAVIGNKVSDVFEIESPQGIREYKVKKIS